MKRSDPIHIDSVALPVFIVDRLVSERPSKPRLEMLFDPCTRVILGFKLTDDGRQIG